MREKVFSTVKLMAKFAFAFGILWYMVQKGRLDLSVVRRGFAHLDYLAASAILVLAALSMSLYRWKLLLKGQNLELSFSQSIRYGMIGAFFNTTMPGAVSGDLIKAWYVISDMKGRRKTPVLTSILLDRVLGVFGLVLVAASPLLLFGYAYVAYPAMLWLVSRGSPKLVMPADPAVWPLVTISVPKLL